MAVNLVKFFLVCSCFFAPLSFAKPWKGVEIITKEEFKYGAFEARIRGARGSGLIVAFFLWKNDSSLANTLWQEQNIEIFGRDGRFQTQLMTPGNPRTENNAYHRLAGPAWNHYFTYRMEWTPHYLAFYVDGNLVRKETDIVVYEKMLDSKKTEPAQLRLSLWAGNFYWSGRFNPHSTPAAAFIDYSAVYHYTPGLGDNGSDFSLHWKDEFDTINRERWRFADWTFDLAVNDYIEENAAAIDGKLVLLLTDENSVGKFPSDVPKNNKPLPAFPVGRYFKPNQNKRIKRRFLENKPQ